MWVQLTNGNFANLVACQYLYAVLDNSQWVLRTSPGTGTLVGTYASEAAAQDAARRLVTGVDPSAYV